ncbi:MAG: glycosyltransferase family 1 protein [Bryobacteraceae bacterium]
MAAQNPPAIAVNATHLGSRINGIGTYIINLLREWARQPASLCFDVYLHERARPHLADISFPENFHLHWISSRLFPDTANLRRLIFSNCLAMSRNRGLVFNPSQLEMTFAGARAIVTVQDLIPIQITDHYQRKQSYFYRHLVPRGLSRAAAIIAPSKATQQAICQRYAVPPEKVTVIPYGVRKLPESSLPSPSRKYILFAGRMVPYRNLNTLIQAFLQIQDNIEHDLILAGEICCDLNVPPRNERVIVRGYVQGDELAALYRGASAFVFPSLAEGFGFPPLEAMAWGCPVISTAEASLPEVCRNAALIVDPRNAVSVAAALTEVLSNQELRANLVREGFQRVAELTWEKTASAHLKLFATVLSESTR